jgi:hypothetical protein
MEGKEVGVTPVTPSGQTTTTISGSSKTKTRVAHAPSASTSNATFLQRPIIEPDTQAKVPSNIRQRYLNR